MSRAHGTFKKPQKCFNFFFLIRRKNLEVREKALICDINNSSWDFPGGPVVKNPPSNAGDPDAIPDQGTKIPHAAGRLSPRATATEPARLN